MVLQHLGELALLTYQLHHAHHEERAPEDQEAADQHRHRPQCLGVALEAAPRLMVLLILLMMMLGILAAVLVSHPGAGTSDSGDLPLVAAGDPQDVQVDVDEDGEHGEEAHDEDDHGELLDDGEKGAEAVVVVGLHLVHHH